MMDLINRDKAIENIGMLFRETTAEHNDVWIHYNHGISDAIATIKTLPAWCGTYTVGARVRDSGFYPDGKIWRDVEMIEELEELND